MKVDRAARERAWRKSYPVEAKARDARARKAFKKKHGMAKSSVWNSANPEQKRANDQKWFDENWEQTKALHQGWLRNKKYCLSPEQYQKMFEEQRGCCAICGTHQSQLTRALSVDHDHECCPGDSSCGKCIRGLLCDACNPLLGLSRDRIAILLKAIEYLKKFQRGD